MERAKALKVNAGTEPDADLGPVISKQVCLWSLFFLFPCCGLELKCNSKSLDYCLRISIHCITFPDGSCIRCSYICLLNILTILSTTQAKEQIHKLIQSGVESGARLVLDGRNIVVDSIVSITFIIAYS